MAIISYIYLLNYKLSNTGNLLHFSGLLRRLAMTTYTDVIARNEAIQETLSIYKEEGSKFNIP